MRARPLHPWCFALLLVVPTSAALARSGVAASPVPAPRDPPAAQDSLPLAPDSTRALPDSTLDVETCLVRLDARRTALPPSDRRVLDELLAAAREMYDAGDIEAAALLVRDAAEFVDERSR